MAAKAAKAAKKEAAKAAKKEAAAEEVEIEPRSSRNRRVEKEERRMAALSGTGESSLGVALYISHRYLDGQSRFVFRLDRTAAVCTRSDHPLNPVSITCRTLPAAIAARDVYLTVGTKDAADAAARRRDEESAFKGHAVFVELAGDAGNAVAAAKAARAIDVEDAHRALEATMRGLYSAEGGDPRVVQALARLENRLEVTPELVRASDVRRGESGY